MATVLKTTTETAAGKMTFKVDSAQDMGMDHPDILKLAAMLQGLHRDLELLSVVFKAQPANQNVTYLYEFEAMDGRKWTQVLDFSGDVRDPTMTFTTDPWKLSEFAHNRPIRDHMVYMHWALGVTEVKCDFDPA